MKPTLSNIQKYYRSFQILSTSFICDFLECFSKNSNSSSESLSQTRWNWHWWREGCDRDARLSITSSVPNRTPHCTIFLVDSKWKNFVGGYPLKTSSNCKSYTIIPSSDISHNFPPWHFTGISVTFRTFALITTPAFLNAASNGSQGVGCGGYKHGGGHKHAVLMVISGMNSRIRVTGNSFMLIEYGRQS